jgi:hypothetical protein
MKKRKYVKRIWINWIEYWILRTRKNPNEKRKYVKGKWFDWIEHWIMRTRKPPKRKIRKNNIENIVKNDIKNNNNKE